MRAVRAVDLHTCGDFEIAHATMDFGGAVLGVDVERATLHGVHPGQLVAGRYGGTRAQGEHRLHRPRPRVEQGHFLPCCEVVDDPRDRWRLGLGHCRHVEADQLGSGARCRGVGVYFAYGDDTRHPRETPIFGRRWTTGKHRDRTPRGIALDDVSREYFDLSIGQRLRGEVVVEVVEHRAGHRLAVASCAHRCAASQQLIPSLAVGYKAGALDALHGPLRGCLAGLVEPGGWKVGQRHGECVQVVGPRVALPVDVEAWSEVACAVGPQLNVVGEVDPLRDLSWRA